MKAVDNEINLSISGFQDFNELNAEELEAVTGGYSWDEFIGGFKSFGKGAKDHSAASPSRADDFWYNIGYGGSDFLHG